MSGRFYVSAAKLLASNRPMRAISAVVVLLTWLGGAGCDCGAERSEIIVDLRTDFVPGVEFVEARVHLGAGGGAAASWPAGVGDDFIAPVRIATLATTDGERALRVDLVDPAGTPFAGRATRVSVRGRTLVTVVITRDCRGVVCPNPGGDPALTSCESGRCVDPGCTPEHPELCPDPVCAVDADCPDRECADGTCASGACLLRARPDACGAGEWCEPETGCRPLDGDRDAGPVPPDAGPLAPDAGPHPPDAGPPLDCRAASPRLCSTATRIGRVTGDAVGAGTRLTTGGTTDAWHLATIAEGMPVTQDLMAQVTLTNPAGADYDLHVYCLSCGGTELAAGSRSEPVETIDLGGRDTMNDDTFDILIEVRFVSATACGRWSLSVEGGVVTSDRSCR